MFQTLPWKVRAYFIVDLLARNGFRRVDWILSRLSLLYNAPRAATIIANEDSTLYALDRDCFNAIVKDASVKRRERFEAFLSRVELLQTLDSYEKNNFCDVLESETFEAGHPVVRQGEPGKKFYFIEEGRAEAVIKEGDKVSFEVEPGQKGPVAVRVKLAEKLA